MCRAKKKSLKNADHEISKLKLSNAITNQILFIFLECKTPRTSIDYPFLLLLNVPQILKTRVHL